jgi:hypothetical protein
VIALLVWINGGSSGTSSAALASPRAVPPSVIPLSSSPVTTPSPSTSSIPSPAPSTTPHHHQPSSVAVHRHSPRPTRLTAMAPVQVLNNSRITGLAHDVAASVQERGWHVVLIGNLQGLIAETTVYYAPGQHAAAVHLAHDFPAIRRVEPNSAAGLDGSGITLVLTRDWVGE